jgi:hypothetical protein
MESTPLESSHVAAAIDCVAAAALASVGDGRPVAVVVTVLTPALELEHLTVVSTIQNMWKHNISFFGDLRSTAVDSAFMSQNTSQFSARVWNLISGWA